MTELAEPRSDRGDCRNAGRASESPTAARTDPDTADAADLDAAEAAERLRERGERVRRRELETALRRLRADGELSAAEREAVAALSVRLTDALVEQWASTVTDGEVDAETALALLAE